MIRTYFVQIKRIIDQYAATSFVLEARLNVDMRPGDQGYPTSTFESAKVEKRDNLQALKPLEEKFRDDAVYHPVVCKACLHGHEETSLERWFVFMLY